MRIVAVILVVVVSVIFACTATVPWCYLLVFFSDKTTGISCRADRPKREPSLLEFVKVNFASRHIHSRYLKKKREKKKKLCDMER